MSAVPARADVSSFNESPGQPRRAAALAALDNLGGVVRASRLGERPAPATVSTGIAELDALTGGLPRGALTEICGPASSGRTSVLLSVLAQMTCHDEVCALVDASDSFDPRSAQAAGVELGRVLWVRCNKEGTPRRRDAEKISDFSFLISEGWSHSRRTSEIRNRKSEMSRLEQALKATDLLLQGGGFGLVVVDLGDIAPSAARRVPLTSWFRFRRAVENTATVLLVIEQEPYAKTCASVVVRMSAVGCRSWAGKQHSLRSAEPAHASILRALEIHAEVVRDRAAPKKPVRSAGTQFAGHMEWAANL